ncbi:hypothetical protein PT138_04935 (plasmid) [Borreliella garinii]|nr:hypothetical protein PT139_04915 [Borreliella garinii]WNZ68149.1 hypothetical protein PT135_04925 [Borreliella garinii]WNZ69147.1 hypothetical protein PT138_04935 [Borreliella garinii]WNZ71150.1 hypothetical protein PT141_04935 [Borreliella garinii]
MLPTLNEQADKDSTDIVHSYIDFVLGGLLATKNTILQVNIKQNETHGISEISEQKKLANTGSE